MGAVIILPSAALTQRRIGLTMIRKATDATANPMTDPARYVEIGDEIDEGVDCLLRAHAIFLRANGLTEPRPYWLRVPRGPSRQGTRAVARAAIGS